MRPTFERLESRYMMHDGHDHPQSADFNRDGTVDKADLHQWVDALGVDASGDANADGVSDGADFLIWQQQFNPPVPPPDPDPEPPPTPDPPTPHPDDPAKRDEHLAMMALVPTAEATVWAVAPGLWSAESTWNRPPVAGDKVWIPAQFEVAVDTETAALKWLRVDGTLSASKLFDSHLTVDTLVGTTTGHLNYVTSKQAKITIADLGPIDFAADPFALSRGIVWHGSSQIEGTAKTTWTTSEPVVKNATTLTVSDATGWRVGDRLILGGAAYQLISYKWQLVPQDDDVRIVSIMGRLIGLDRPLAFDHFAIDSQNPVVINMTRNVVIESANPALDRRGHVMFMHNPQQVVNYAEWNDLGRTDKRRNISVPDGKGAGLENPNGRYSLHFHRTGSASQAAVAIGNAISGSPGWGLVNHDSHVNADRNVSYNVFGAHFVTELGNERGSFTNNVAIRADGTGTLLGSLTPVDFGHSGDGFWIEGSNVPVEGNVAIGMRSSGFTIFAPGNEAFTFRNNVSLQSKQSLSVWESRFPGVLFPQLPPAGTAFSDISGNLLQGGVLMGYSGCLEFRSNTVLSFDNNASPYGFSHTGINASIRYIDNRVTGFQTGILMPTEGESAVEGGYYDNLETNLLVMNTQQNFYRRIDIAGATFGSRAAWNVEMSISFFSYDLSYAYGPNKSGYLGPPPDWRKLFEIDNKAVGDQSQVTLDGVKLYFEEQAMDFQFGERLKYFPAEIRYEPDGVTLATGASLNARGLYVGGKPLPAGEQTYQAKVRGVFV